MKIRAAAIQTNSTPNRSRNLEMAEKLLKEAVRKKAKLVAFPENFSLLTENRRQLMELAEDLRGPSVQALQTWARKHRIWIHCGSVPIRDQKNQNRVTNTSLVFDSSGRRIGRYDKIHLFDAVIPGDRSYQESRSYRPGKKIVVVKTRVGRFGMSVCYDLRFPELYRALSKKGAEMIFIPSAFTIPTGKAHWDLLTRSRAVENQAYVLAPAQVGKHYPGRKTYGHTRIVDPWGSVLGERKKGVGVVIADLDLKFVEKVRKKLPALRHRRI